MLTADSSKTGEEFIRFLCIFLFYVSLYCLLVVADPVSLQHLSVFDGSVIGRFRFSSTAAPQPNEKETTKSGSEQGKGAENEGLNENAEESATAEAKASGKENESDSDLDLDLEDLSRDDLVKLVSEKEEILKMKHEEFQNMKDKYMRAFAEMENVMGRTKREAENSKKYAIQNFAKGLLDVADNLGRAGSVVKESFSKIDQSADTAGAGPLLKTLLEGVEMTDKQLAEVLKKAGVEKFDPLNEQFDPNKHNALFQVPNPSKPAGTVAAVLKVLLRNETFSSGMRRIRMRFATMLSMQIKNSSFQEAQKTTCSLHTEMVKRAAEVAGVGCIG
ncbi:primary active transporter [Lithospermum erythrorhizon]|uniref:Primary active transporter n=1 Tax=Lithospermum erythrorhizon TaxID=34254 RepID=A0AAV3PL36_LITER